MQPIQNRIGCFYFTKVADLFARIVLRGGVDLLDMLVGRRAAAKLVGRGLSSVGAYFGYLEEEMKLWRGRQAGGSGIRQGAVAVEEEAATTSTRPAAQPARKPGKLTAGSSEHKAHAGRIIKREVVSMTTPGGASNTTPTCATLPVA